MAQSRKDLTERYIRTSWIIKIRLMSSRRQLWDKQVSLIHLESACLQLRKICECIAQLCLIAADINFKDIHKKVRKIYEVGKILKYLENEDRLKFISRARLKCADKESTPRLWILDKKDPQDEDRHRIVKIFNACGNILHETSPYKPFPCTTEEAAGTLLQNRNAIRTDHQWLWNFMWQHAIQIVDSKIFFVDFNDTNNIAKPLLIKGDDFLDQELDFEFDPEFVSDFVGPVNWDEFDGSPSSESGPNDVKS